MKTSGSCPRVGLLVLGASAVLVIGVALPTFSAHTRQSGTASRSPIYGIKLPDGYRNWTLISVAQENGKNNDIRAILGNDIAVRAFLEGRRPFPDGTAIVRLAWRYQSSPRNDAVFPAPQSFVAGASTNVQVSVKDSKRYLDTAGWGYGQFDKGKANQDEALAGSCFACHAKLEKSADFVFTSYSR